LSERSQVFELLNLDERNSDIESLVAYALYKQHKREWCVEYEIEHGAQPSPEEKLRFAKSVSTPTQLERYRKDARDALGEFSDVLISDVAPEIENNAITGRIEAAASRIEKQGGFPKLLLGGVVSTLISTSVLILLAIGLRLFGIDLVEGISQLSAPMSEE
jgi:hypothetical protein